MNKLQLSSVQDLCLENGFKFLDKDYIGINHKHTFFCIKHGKISKSTVKSIKRKRGISCCKRAKKKEKLQLNKDKVIDKMSTLGLKLLGEYKGLREKHLIRCLRHKKAHLISIYNAFNRKGKLPCCKNVSKHNMDETKMTKEEAESWRTKVVKFFNNTCQICNRKRLEFENIVSYCFSKRLSLDDSACMCSGCDSEFHRVYGFKNNTYEQYREFSFSHYKKQREKVERIKKLR